MNIPKQPKTTRERLEVKLDRKLIEDLDAYCQFKESDRDWIVSHALIYAFRKDREFRDWSTKHPKTATT